MHVANIDVQLIELIRSVANLEGQPAAFGLVGGTQGELVLYHAHSSGILQVVGSETGVLQGLVEVGGGVLGLVADDHGVVAVGNLAHVALFDELKGFACHGDGVASLHVIGEHKTGGGILAGGDRGKGAANLGTSGVVADDALDCGGICASVDGGQADIGSGGTDHAGLQLLRLEHLVQHLIVIDGGDNGSGIRFSTGSTGILEYTALLLAVSINILDRHICLTNSTDTGG